MKIQENVLSLIEVLKEKEQYLCEILTLTKEQTIYLKDEEIEQLIENIEKKQVIIEQINKIDQMILKDNLIQREDSSQDIKMYIEKIEKLLKEINQQDHENTKKLEHDLDELKVKMKELKTKQQGNKIRSNYMKQYVDVQGIFIDRK